MEYKTLLQQLAHMGAEVDFHSLPSEFQQTLPPRVLDILGLCVAASTLESSESVLKFAGEIGGNPSATAIGLTERTSAPMAAFVNGVLAHSLDFDDTHLPSILHPSASVVPAALAVGEHHERSGIELLAAVAVGLEITVRLGMAGYRPAEGDQPGQSIYFEHGQHATSICGAIGSAAAAAKLAGLDAKGMANSMAVACSMASGIIEANRTGGTVKRMHCGWAAQAGVTAAMLTAGGITGAPTALEGRFGLFQALLRDDWNSDPLLDGLGDVWQAANIFYKPYPANHFTHTAIDAATALRDQGLRPQDVESARLSVASATVRTIGEPLESKQRPANGYQAQFSGPYVVAAALRGGSGLGLGLGDFNDEAVHDPELMDLMGRIVVEGSPICDDIYPYQFPAILEVTTKDGRVLTEQALVNRGGDKAPLSDREMGAKFSDNVSGLLKPGDADELVELVASLRGPMGCNVLELMRPLKRLRETSDD